MTADDYDPADGVADNGIDHCAHCETSLSPERYHDDVYDQSGRSYDILTNTDANNRPFFCADCWPELRRNERMQTNANLGDFQ